MERPKPGTKIKLRKDLGKLSRYDKHSPPWRSEYGIVLKDDHPYYNIDTTVAVNWYFKNGMQLGEPSYDTSYMVLYKSDGEYEAEIELYIEPVDTIINILENLDKLEKRYE